ncbi:alpha/beta fold hydrolase [Winogradskyella sp.]|uniref:alpha/beta hydrolase family protein n=1 Tax=Winogradskyella sp. TaxID=1883156 RepID=UPI00260F2FD7|nr:alpha/beta fold hydrolase [Winogradskyella sp.]
MKKLLIIGLFLLSQYSIAQNTASSEQLYEFTLEQIEPVIVSNENYQPFAKYVKNGIKAFKLTYKSTMKSEEVLLSGSILFPLNQKNPGIVIFCHGTQFNQNVSSNWNNPLHIEALPALNGYITFLPDYLGYGISEGQLPAYFDKTNALKHLEDFITNGLNVLEQQSIQFKNELSIIGFSQGGHLALSFAEKYRKGLFQNTPIHNTISIGGPTDLVQNLQYVLNQKIFAHSAYVPYLVGVHNHNYWKMSTSNLFHNPFSQMVSDFSKGKISLEELTKKTPQNIEEFVKPEIRNPKGKLYRKISRKLNKHSLKPFKTSISLTFVHSRSDEDVPFDIMNEFYQKMKKRNKSTNLVEVQGNHNTSGLFGMGIAMDILNN